MERNRTILDNKTYLYATEFFAGMAVMAVELGASRLLAPYFSSSQIVWTIIIGTIMIAIALGNIWGGRTADKDPDPDRLYRRILIAAIWIAAIPVVGKYVIIGITGLLVLTVNTNFLIWAAFFACMIVFVFPLFLLGTITPSLIKYSTDNLEHNARVAGNLSAFNTVGSIIGTFLPTFVTIPSVGTSVTFLIFSGILLLIGILYFISMGRNRRMAVISVILFLVCSLLGHTDRFAFWDNSLTYEGESIYNYLQVKEDERSVIFSTNVLFGVQSVKMKEDELTGMYYDYALAAPVMADVSARKNPRMLVLGMGTGTFAGQCRKYFPRLLVEGVEIDQKITDLAHEYFDLSPDIPVTTYDGRAFLNVSKEKYDVIMVDAYQDITIPFQMSSTEFFTLVRDHLKPDGVMVVNMNMYTEDQNSISGWLSNTIASVFDHVYTVDVAGSTNRELIATLDSSIREGLPDKISNLPPGELRTMMYRVNRSLNDYHKGEGIFTDDKAPVELMGMKVIDSLIANEIDYYRDILKKEGIPGLMNN